MNYQNIANKLYKTPWFAILFLILTLIRFLHFGEIIDEPHSWRQCDTANYILDFYKNGLNILKPSVSWQGNQNVLILEFPLHEAIAAIGYNLFGPTIVIARTVTLTFFIGSALYFFYIVKYLFYPRLAKITTLIYLALPLSQYYSRAVHVDFLAVFFGHAMLYHMIRGYDEEKTTGIFLSCIFGTFAVLIKIPYAFYMFLPIVYHFVLNLKVKKLFRWLPLFFMPIIFFLLWRYHTEIINSQSPDWFFIPGYMKFVNMYGWYFGALSMRFNPKTWHILGERLLYEVTTYPGLVLFVIGFFLKPYKTKSTTFFRIWFAGVVIYLLIFFNLNVIHNYYQIPFLAVASFFIGITIESTLFIKWNKNITRFLAVILTGAVLISSFLFSERHYYKIDRLRVISGNVINEQTDKDSLIIASFPRTDPRDPRLLYRAKRNGWSINSYDLTEELIKKLIENGAEYLTVTLNHPLPQNLTYFLKQYSQKKYAFNDNRWKLNIYDLRNHLE